MNEECTEDCASHSCAHCDEPMDKHTVQSWCCQFVTKYKNCDCKLQNSPKQGEYMGLSAPTKPDKCR